ncbi:hypothetical protein ACSTS3_08135 [Aquimarina muelleri]|uniref:hypothetical protein n=1 Tax=Aquimarina muelleri TaxID=279356 RepID=UPI003F682374
MPIKDRDYNKAKALLEAAGSKSAEKSHIKHTGSKKAPQMVTAGVYITRHNKILAGNPPQHN